MEAVFSSILNMSLTASLVILIVMAVRLALKRAPKVYSYALWAVVLFRLLCPISLSAPISLLEAAQVPVTVSQNLEQPALTTTIRYVSVGTDQEEWEMPKAVEELEAQQQEPKVKLPLMLAYVWLVGVGAMGLYSAIGYLRLRRCLIGAVRYRGNVYLADHIPSAFVMGILFPKIYLPSSTPHRERQYLITHERHHIRRGDHIIKWLAYLALCLHWFNPLVWTAFLLAGKDMEMSCDEAVIKRLGEKVRADYSASLLRLSVNRRRIAGTPLSFGEGDTKGRVLNMARWKQPKLWVSLLCIPVCIVILAACALNPDGKQETTSYTTLDDGLSLSLPEDHVWVQNGQDVTFLKEGIVVGGVDTYEKPAFDLKFGGEWEDSQWNQREWLEAMDFPDAKDATLGHMGGGSQYGVYEVEYFRDLPPEEKEQMGDYVRFHTFFVGQSQVYDVWFDRLTIEDAMEYTVLKTVVVNGEEPGGQVDFPSEEAETVQSSTVKTDLEMFSHTGSFASNDGTVEFTWNLQDQLVFPEEMPTIEVSQRKLSAEEVRKIAETLFEGAVFYQPEDTFEEEYSKAELQKKLDLWEHYTDEENLAWLYPDRTQPGDTYIQDEADLVRRFIEDYSARMETAPEEKNDAVYDWVYGKSSYGNGYWTQFEYNGIPYKFHSDGTEISLYIYSGAGPSTIEDDHYEAILTRTDMPTQDQVDAVRAKVEELIQTIDLGSWQITNCYVEAGAYGEYMTSVAQYKIIVDVQPVFQGAQIMSWGENGRWSRQGMHLEYAPNGQLMTCWLQSFYNLENITQPQPLPDKEALLQMAEQQLVHNTRASFGLPQNFFEGMGDGEDIVCKVDIMEISSGLLLTNHPSDSRKMQFVPGIIFRADLAYCGAETGKVYLTNEEWTGEAVRRILAMNPIDGSVVSYPET